MSTLAIQHHIAGILVPFGVTGAVIAVAGALLAAVAFAMRGAEFGGVASAVWVCGAILSAAAGYAGDWAPLIVALAPAPLAAAAFGIRRALAARVPLPTLVPVDTATTPLPA
ncbi:hypothetical protein [Microbacterium hydrocarbonoxydans]|uniref:hypothetical protein n=1 Tax=Microbacterium hydrocarbonoxydans TaxID=273678 RepID=UPI0007BBA0D8|nr:hypothetical protein [Microbacterium hydrocarbonoxydans]GAT74403.1 hypothetical protein MHM582_2908 [Microbacterium sp. HM58-2]